MRFVSYNILNPYHAVKWNTLEGLNTQGVDNWELGRKEKVMNNLKNTSFDIACIQEMSDRTYDDFREFFTIADFSTHFSEEAPQGEHGPAILYNSERVELLQHKKIQTPKEDYRVAIMSDFRDQLTKEIIRVLSVHLKGYNPYETDLDKKRESQVRGDKELRYYLKYALHKTHMLDGVVIMGDYNEDTQEMIDRADSSRQGVLIKHGFVWDGVQDVTESRTERKIDWIFFKDLHTTARWRLQHHEVDQDRSASDHAITCCDLIQL